MAVELMRLTRKGLKGVARSPIAVRAGGQLGQTALIITLEEAAMVQKSSRLYQQPSTGRVDSGMRQNLSPTSCFAGKGLIFSP